MLSCIYYFLIKFIKKITLAISIFIVVSYSGVGSYVSFQDSEDFQRKYRGLIMALHPTNYSIHRQGRDEATQ